MAFWIVIVPVGVADCQLVQFTRVVSSRVTAIPLAGPVTSVRPWGDRFLRCESPNGTVVNISGARNNEKMGDGDAGAHWGIEHIGISVDDLDAEIERLAGMGAKLMEGPVNVPGGGPRIAFIEGPDRVRIELLQPSA